MRFILSPRTTQIAPTRLKTALISLGYPQADGRCERVEKGFGGFEVDRVEPFGEAIVDRLEECPGISGTALIAL